MHRDYYAVVDFILMAVGPPVVGSAIGLLVGLRRHRPGLAAFGGLLGGNAGAWVGVAFYRLVVLPNHCDFAIFQACVLVGLLVGAIPLGWYVGGPAAATASAGDSMGHGLHGVGCAMTIALVLLSLVGLILFQLGGEASSYMPVDRDLMKTLVLYILGGMGALVLGLLLFRRRCEQRPK